MTECSKVLEDGSPCRAPAMHDSAWCRAHSDVPDVIRSRQEGSRRGGLASHRGPAPSGVTVDVSSAQGILEMIRRVAQAVADGSLDRSRAGGIVYAMTVATQARRTIAYEERLARIERRLGIGGDGEQAR